MAKLKSRVIAFLLEEDGVTLAEYLVLLGILVAGVAAAVTTFSGGLSTAFKAWGTWAENISTPG